MMIKDSKKLTSGSKLLLTLLHLGKLSELSMSLGTFRTAVYPEMALLRANTNLNNLIYKLNKSGKIKLEYTESKKIIKLTKKGELEAIFAKAKSTHKKIEKGKWWLIVFDIPERARKIREKLRKLLRQLGFKPLQASVYISPYTINPVSIEYLNRTKLNRYIRIMRIDKIDSVKDLKKSFNL